MEELGDENRLHHGLLQRKESVKPICYWLASIVLFLLKKTSECMTWNTRLNTEIRETSQKIYREEPMHVTSITL